ncbi:MAG TPA: hypothetical protein VMN58_13095 [Acidimicrobiales bacterium]|nr:hypothetical protein [Acidimicrobiales bacterium]
MPRLIPFVLMFALVAGISVNAEIRAEAQGPPDTLSPIAQERSVEAVVLEGSQFPDWSAGPEISAREPVLTSLNSDCDDNHNCSQASRVNNPLEGVAVDRLLGYSWDADSQAFVQIPFQVDERFTRYISNLASNCSEAGPFCAGFGMYSGADPQLSYVYDREGYRFTSNTENDPCTATMEPGDGPEPDPTKGLDDNDELAFLYRDTASEAPATAPFPDGVEQMRAVRLADPSAPDAAPRFAYVALADAEDGAAPAFDAENGYMRYVRDDTADLYMQTSSNYGNAPQGPYCNEDGVVVGHGPRRPRETAWVLSPRYAVQYAGNWVLRGFRVADGDRDEPLNSPSDYGPPLVDQWKARAYQQKPGDTTPCCGFQTEQDDWGKSSVLLGEKAGPVRVIRATWGSNSGTNTVRQELFYPDVVVQQAYLRVHSIPPLGGIFSYWDHTAGVIETYYNRQRPDGVKVDGKNDEVFGTLYANPGGGELRVDDDVPVVGPVAVEAPVGQDCFLYCSDLDVTDPTLNGLKTLSWEQVSGQFGSMVFTSSIEDLNPGAAQAFMAIPYYRDDACFDDGTGINPGPHLLPKQVDDPERPCWDSDVDERPTGDPAHDVKWRQGLIGGHGVQVLFVAESDNAGTTLPLTELASRTTMVMLPGNPGNVGERYGSVDELSLHTLVTPRAAPQAPKRESGVSFKAVKQGNQGTVLVNARLTDDDTQDGLVDRELRIFVDDKLRATAWTAENGDAQVQIAEGSPQGKTFRVEFAGDDRYAPSSAEGEFNKNRASG